MIEPKRLKSLLSKWCDDRLPESMDFKENTEPTNDSKGDYEIAYEVVFKSCSLDKSCVEIWVTTDGYVAIGFERWVRIAARIGVRYSNNRFAAGHEPTDISEVELISIMNLVADGKISIATFSIPIAGLISTTAVISSDEYSQIKSKDGHSYSWLHSEEEFKFKPFSNIVRYRVWGD